MLEPKEEEKIADLAAKEADIRARIEHDRGAIPWANEVDASSAMARIEVAERELRSIKVERTELQSVLTLEARTMQICGEIDELDRAKAELEADRPPTSGLVRLLSRAAGNRSRRPDSSEMTMHLRMMTANTLRSSHLLVQLAVPDLQPRTCRKLVLSYRIPNAVEAIDRLSSRLVAFSTSGDRSELTNRDWKGESYADLTATLSFVARFHLLESVDGHDVRRQGRDLHRILSGMSDPITPEVAAWAVTNLGELRDHLTSVGRVIESEAWSEVVDRMRRRRVRGVEKLERALSFIGMTGPEPADHRDPPTDVGPRR